MSTESLRAVRDHFSDFVDRVEREHDRVTITRNGRPAAVLISVEDLEGLEETLSILSDPDALAAVREGEAALAAGDYVEGVDTVCGLVDRRGERRRA
jgi:prevent-host-death family protein